MEIWKDIEGYEGLYQISNLGRVKSLKRICQSAVGGRTVPEIVRKPRYNKDGYMYVNLHKDGVRKSKKIHRMVAEAFIPNPENKPEVNHIIDKRHNDWESLEWVTKSENEKHAHAIGKKNHKGSNHSQAKLSEGKVMCILEMSLLGISGRDISFIYGVSDSTIYSILSGKKWTHVTI